jgi:hypothetical protein
MWIHGHLNWLATSLIKNGMGHVILAIATLIDFPGFQDVHCSLFTMFRHDPSQPSFDPQQWEIYIKYRQFLSEFLTDRSRSGALFVGPAHYINLAEFFWSFLTLSTSNFDFAGVPRK